MRKLWPPVHDAVSVRIWAAAVAILIIVAGSFSCFRGNCTNTLWWFGFPGGFAFVLATGHGIEEADFSWMGIAAWLVANSLFYYFSAWLAIGSLRPAKAWWPEKRS